MILPTQFSVPQLKPVPFKDFGWGFVHRRQEGTVLDTMVKPGISRTLYVGHVCFVIRMEATVISGSPVQANGSTPQPTQGCGDSSQSSLLACPRLPWMEELGVLADPWDHQRKSSFWNWAHFTTLYVRGESGSQASEALAGSPRDGGLLGCWLSYWSETAEATALAAAACHGIWSLDLLQESAGAGLVQSWIKDEVWRESNDYASSWPESPTPHWFHGLIMDYRESGLNWVKQNHAASWSRLTLRRVLLRNLSSCLSGC